MTPDSRTNRQTHEDMDLYGCSAHMAPETRMTTEEAQELIQYLSNMPTGSGYIISRCVDPIGASPMFGACSVKVVLQGWYVGDANDNNPARAFRRALARAHEAAAKALET